MALPLRLARTVAAHVPGWGWLTLASLLVAPWYLAYLAWVLGGCVQFWTPLR